MATHITPFKKRGRGGSLPLYVFLLLLLIAPHASAHVELKAPEYRNQGYSAQKKGQLGVAKEYYEKAIAIDPYYATPHNDLAILYEMEGDAAKAEGEYLEAIALDPHFVDAIANLALLYEKVGKPDKAVLYWKKRADDGDPNDPWTRKAIERLSVLSKEEIPVTYPPMAFQDIPSQAAAAVPPPPKEYEEFGSLPTTLYYTIGPGDALEVDVWEHPELSHSVKVRPDGRISLLLVDDIYVAGKTPQQVDAEITQRLSATLRNPSVTVIVSDIRSKGVYVLGEVHRPGRYLLTEPRTTLEIITEAGQWLDSAVLTSVMVVRRGWSRHPQVFRVNIGQAVYKGDPSKDMVLEDGDVVFVPRNFVKKLDNFLSFFTKHLRGAIVSGSPVQITQPVEVRY